MLCPFEPNPATSAIPVDYTKFRTLAEVRYNKTKLQCKFAEITTAKGWFNPQVDPLLADPRVSRQIVIKFEKYRSALERVKKFDVAPAVGVACPEDIDLDCAVNCETTAPEYETCNVLPNGGFSIGVSECLRTKKLSMFDAAKELRDNVEAAGKVIELDAWNKLVCEVVNNPIDLPAVGATCIKSTYHDFGSMPVYDALTVAIHDLKKYFGGMEITLFAHPDLELALMRSGSDLHQYINSGIPTAWGNTDVFSNMDYKTMPALSRLWGANIVITGESVYLHNGATNANPFLNEDGSKYYVVFAARDSYYYGSFALQDEPMRLAATCDNANESWVQEWLTYNKILCPDHVVVMAFDVPTC